MTLKRRFLGGLAAASVILVGVNAAEVIAAPNCTEKLGTAEVVNCSVLNYTGNSSAICFTYDKTKISDFTDLVDQRALDGCNDEFIVAGGGYHGP